MERLKLSISLDSDDAPAAHDRPGWWPLDCLRSLGRAASIAAGTFPYLEWHGAYRGFGIFTTCDNGDFSPRIRRADGQVLEAGDQLQRYIDAARFDSREEAAQHARFVIASGALNHLLG